MKSKGHPFAEDLWQGESMLWMGQPVFTFGWREVIVLSACAVVVLLTLALWPLLLLALVVAYRYGRESFSRYAVTDQRVLLRVWGQFREIPFYRIVKLRKFVRFDGTGTITFDTLDTYYSLAPQPANVLDGVFPPALYDIPNVEDTFDLIASMCDEDVTH